MDQDDDESEAEVKPKKADRPRNGAPKLDGVAVGNKVLRAKTRNQGKDQDDSKSQVMKEHQTELHEKIHNRGLSKFKGGNGGDSNDQAKVFRKFESYKREDQLPAGVEDRRVSQRVAGHFVSATHETTRRYESTKRGTLSSSQSTAGRCPSTYTRSRTSARQRRATIPYCASTFNRLVRLWARRKTR